MLSLFLIGIKMNWDNGRFISTLLPTNTSEFKNILAQHSAIRPTQLANILHTVFTTSPDTLKESFSPLFSMLLMEFFPKNLVTTWLNANFQRSNLESLLFEKNTITILTFVSQNDAASSWPHATLNSTLAMTGHSTCLKPIKPKPRPPSKVLTRLNPCSASLGLRPIYVVLFVHFLMLKKMRGLSSNKCASKPLIALPNKTLPTGITSTTIKCLTYHIIF